MIPTNHPPSSPRPDRPAPPLRLIGGSAAIRALDDEISLAARADSKVLITGESGVGKEIAARLIHERSPRASGPLVTINCAGVSETLLESELFGHRRGSFTDAFREKPGLVEVAHGGTLYLDEIGEMGLRMQALLLRFLDTGEVQRVGDERTVSRVNVRVVAATNRHLPELVASGLFRSDLYYRIKVMVMAVPPLRDRLEDIPPLVSHFTETYCVAYRRRTPEITDEAQAALLRYAWPGNVRELRNAVESALARCDRQMSRQHLPREIWASEERQPEPPRPHHPLYERMTAGQESFWTAVYPAFMARDLTRHELQGIVADGLRTAGGDYEQLLRLFHLRPEDAAGFRDFLARHGCHAPPERHPRVHTRPRRRPSPDQEHF